MRNRKLQAYVLATTIAVLAVASAQAQPCTMLCPNGGGPPLVAEFTALAPAQSACKGDEVVWVQNRRVYHKAGWKKFGKTPGGSYICQASAGKVKLKPANLFQRFL